MELVDDKIRCKVDPERWPIPTPAIIGSPRTDFTQLINCPEFVPRQTLSYTNSGQCLERISLEYSKFISILQKICLIRLIWVTLVLIHVNDHVINCRAAAIDYFSNWVFYQLFSWLIKILRALWLFSNYWKASVTFLFRWTCSKYKTWYKVN